MTSLAVLLAAHANDGVPYGTVRHWIQPLSEGDKADEDGRMGRHGGLRGVEAESISGYPIRILSPFVSFLTPLANQCSRVYTVQR